MVVVLVVVIAAGRRPAAVQLGVVRGLGGQELGAQVPGLLVGGAALACFSKLELRVCWEEALVVGWTAEGLLATGLFDRQSALRTLGYPVRRASHTGSKVGLWAVVILTLSGGS